jgi:hypothetical protein
MHQNIARTPRNAIKCNIAICRIHRKKAVFSSPIHENELNIHRLIQFKIIRNLLLSQDARATTGKQSYKSNSGIFKTIRNVV